MHKSHSGFIIYRPLSWKTHGVVLHSIGERNDWSKGCCLSHLICFISGTEKQTKTTFNVTWPT